MPKVFNCSSRWVSWRVCSIWAWWRRGPGRAEELARPKVNRRGFGNVLLQLRQIDFVEGIGHGVVVEQVVVFLLIGNEGGHALQHKIKVVGAPARIGGEGCRVELFQRSYQGGGGIHDVATSAERKASDPSDTGVENHDCDGLVQLRVVGNGVGLEPTMPSSSPEKRIKRMVRRGRKPDALMARSTSITSAALHPLSSAPVPNSHESRCAPSTTNSSGFSLPRSSATTLAAVIGPPTRLGMERSA